MLLRYFYDEKLAQASYLVGCVATGEALVVDPARNVLPYLRAAEKEGLDKVLVAAGFEWREPGCSLCTAINGDQLKPGERCASTSNRNFRGRQGTGGRTHLVSPAMAAAAAIKGHFVDVRELLR